MAQQCIGEFGPQGDFKKLGLDTSSHPQSSFSVDKNERCEVKFKSTKPIKFTCKLLKAENEDDDLSAYVFSQRYDDCIHFIINFPAAGSYKLQVYALPGDSKETSMPNVYNYLINVKSATKTVHPFPKQYAQWKDGCSLEEPLCLNSQCSLTSVTFKVNIPNAKAAAVVVNGEDWNHLQKKEGTCCFTGNFDLHKLRNTGAKVTLNATFDEKSGSYPTFLEYKF